MHNHLKELASANRQLEDERVKLTNMHTRVASELSELREKHSKLSGQLLSQKWFLRFVSASEYQKLQELLGLTVQLSSQSAEVERLTKSNSWLMAEKITSLDVGLAYRNLELEFQQVCKKISPAAL